MSGEMSEMKTSATASNAVAAPVIGRSVVAADGRCLGRVVSAWDDTIVVERGRWFPIDYFLPVQAIDASGTVDREPEQVVRLTLTCDEARRLGKIGGGRC